MFSSKPEAFYVENNVNKSSSRRCFIAKSCTAKGFVTTVSPAMGSIATGFNPWL
jgi:hypothetical protein